ncbi:MAG TPA: sulfotransferase, partial [Novosphingobium sp.]|nr:sulfotransferase [Novosphingobium sp.]
MAAKPQDALTEMMRRIVVAARAGRMDEAAALVAQAEAAGAPRADLAGPAQASTFAALAGAVAFYRGDHAGAAAWLAPAHAARPADMTIRANLAEALWHCARPAEALALCEEEAARADRSLRLARLGAHLAQEAEDFARAAALYRIVVEAAPDDWSAWNNLGNALSPLGDVAGALAAATRAAALAPDSAPVRLNLAHAQAEAGEREAAMATLRALSQDFPEDTHAPHALYVLARDAGDAPAADAALSEAVARAPTRADLQAELGQLRAQIGAFAAAEAPLRTAVALDPQLGQGWVGLASLLERLNREDEIAPLRAEAAASGTDAASLSFIDALRLKREGDYAGALDALDRAGTDVVTPGQRLHLRGVLLDRLKRADEAFAAFAQMNAHWAADASDPRGRAAAYRAGVAANSALLTREWAQGWTPDPAPQRPAPIFVLGFPRSGTTLLDTMLMAEPRVRVLEEEAIIADIEAQLGGVAALPALSGQQIEAARATYFARADALAGSSPEHVIVDKHPMHLVHAPTIRRLFPDARFVLALRHPCDVLLSCFLTNFRLNDAMANFLDLGDAAALYEAAFGQWQAAREVLGLAVGT